jgi:hypothetical protein
MKQDEPGREDEEIEGALAIDQSTMTPSSMISLRNILTLSSAYSRYSNSGTNPSSPPSTASTWARADTIPQSAHAAEPAGDQARTPVSRASHSASEIEEVGRLPLAVER